MEHIERIERISDTTVARGVPHDYIRCKLFEFSLADKASGWLNSLRPESLVGWSAVRSAFLDHYFTKSKTAQLRAKISGFQQHLRESFCEAWDRFKMYQRDCPHHGISDTELLNIFYDGVAWEHKSALNAASNGNFMTCSVIEATNLINNFAESCSDMSEESKSNEVSYVNGQMSKQGYNFNSRNNSELPYQSKSVENPQVYPPPNTFNANPDSRSFQGQYQGPYHPPIRSYQAPYQPPRDNSQDDLKAMMQMLLTNQQKLAVDINAKVDGMYRDLNSKFDTLSSHVKKLDTQIAQTAEAVRRQPGILPGKTELNPRVGHVNAIEVKSDTSELPCESKAPPKLGDPGKFAIPVKIGLTDFPTSLCDLGSSVNLMSYSAAKKLGFNKLEPTNISLMFADCSLRDPLGILANIPVQVGHVVVPADFVVLKMEEEPDDPLILGRPFLRTAGAKINVRRGSIELNIGTNVLYFQMDKLLPSPLLDGDPFTAVLPDKDAKMRRTFGDSSNRIYEPPWRAKKAKQRATKDHRSFTTECHFSDPPRLW